MTWKAGARERLADLRSQGMTFPLIADHINREFGMHVTYPACIGMLHRMTVKPIEEPVVSEFDLPPPIVPEIPRGPVTIYELGRSDCHWPLGKHHDHPPYLYCGLPAFEGRPYCSEHCGIAYNTPVKRWA
jgi:hypothetical protein